MKITYYNTNLLFNYIKLFRELKIIKEEFTDDYINLYKEASLSEKKHLGIIDRTNANKFFIPTVEYEIPKEKNNDNKTFKQLCENRSIELLNTGKRLNVFWSGGIDSTTVLFSLMNKANDLSQIRVILTVDSIMESGSMFDLLIKNKIEYIILPKKSSQNFFKSKEFINFDLNKELIITGAQIDTLYTILKLRIPTDEQYHNMQYEEVLLRFTNKNIVDFYNKSVKCFPKEIKSYKDFLKFYCYSFQWHEQKHTLNIGIEQKYISIIHSFYDTPNKDFEKWSLWSNESEITFPIKIPQRNLIYELTGDKLYSYKKNKGMSFPFVITNNNWFFLLENGYTVTHGDVMNKTIDLTNTIYDDIKEKHAEEK